MKIFEDRPKDSMDRLTDAALAIAAIFALVTWLGFVASIMWGWFVVPLGAPAIGTAHAIGLMCIWALLSTKKSKSDGDSTGAYWQSAVQAMGGLFLLGAAWIARAFM